MKMVVLVENSSRCRLCAEHGLSVYIEYEGKTYLLDTGATALFAENAKELGIDLSKVDTAFLSHAHYDHSGGFEEFFKENDKAAVYMQETSAENCFYRTEGKDKYIGIPQHLLENYKERFRPLNAVCEVEKGVWVVPHFTGGLDEMGRRAHMYRKIGESQNLLMNTELPIGTISDRMGFLDNCHFSTTFKKYIGLTPTQYRQHFQTSQK